MRLYNFLNEFGTPVVGNIIDILKKDCSYFIDNFYKKYNQFFYKGSTKLYAGNLTKASTRHRYSRVLDIDYFKFINNWLDSRGFVRRDNSVILTPDKDIARNWGTVSYVFPIGKFKYTYCMARDFNKPNDKFKSIYFVWLYILDNSSNINLCTKYIPDYHRYDLIYYDISKTEQEWNKKYKNKISFKDAFEGRGKLSDKRDANIMHYSYSILNLAVLSDEQITIDTGIYEWEGTVKDLKNSEIKLASTISNKNFQKNSNYEFWIDAPECYYYVPENRKEFENLMKEI